jgi:hypothetical protein
MKPLRPPVPPAGRRAAAPAIGRGGDAAPATGSWLASPSAGSFPAGAAGWLPAGESALPASRKLRGFSVASSASPSLTRVSRALATAPEDRASFLPIWLRGEGPGRVVAQVRGDQLAQRAGLDGGCLPAAGHGLERAAGLAALLASFLDASQRCAQVPGLQRDGDCLGSCLDLAGVPGDFRCDDRVR